MPIFNKNLAFYFLTTATETTSK